MSTIKRIVSIGSTTDEQFRRAADEAARSGATHLVLTRDLPESTWQFDVPGDPYPAWFVVQPGLLKVFCPQALQGFLNPDYAARVQDILAKRCAILREYGLKGAYMTNEPQVLPEAVFEAHPHWRGPRVDHPFRSRTARFAPCVAKAEVQALYHEALATLAKNCPEIDTLFLMTIDSGSGLCWAPALYPGPNGCADCNEGDFEERAAAFLKMLHAAGVDAGLQLEIDFAEIEPRSWMRKAFPNPARVARLLPSGLSVNHIEGPDAKPFIRPLSLFGNLFYSAFYPVIGLSHPLALTRQMISDAKFGGRRFLCNLGDGSNGEWMFRLYRALLEQDPRTEMAGLNCVQSQASEEFGTEKGGALMDAWLALQEAETQLGSLNFGPYLLMGGLLGRWLTRPLVPFPQELSEQETSGFLPYLFQARDRESALNIADIQAMRMYEGWSGRLLVEQTLAVTNGQLKRAQAAAQAADEPQLVQRIELLRCLLKSTLHAVSYQAQLDEMPWLPSAEGETPNPVPPPLGFSGDWGLQELTRIARAEIDNTLAILALIESSDAPMIDSADAAEDETPLRLGPDFADKLRLKVAVMNQKWLDYNRFNAWPNK